MLDETAARAAHDLIWETWQAAGRIAALPEALRPATRAEGYAIQAHLEARSARPLFGWKIAATSRAGQQHIGVDGPLAGRILADMVVPAGSAVPLSDNAMRVAEPEFVFRIGRDLPPRETAYGQAEVMAAVAALHLGIEVPDSRFADFSTAGGPQLIADNACAHRFALGPEAPALWRGLDLAQHRVRCTVAPRYEREGIGANVLGDPRIALTWIANELSRHGVTLRAGECVTTGTCAVPLEVQPGDAVTVDFGQLGSMGLRFVD
ncbi:2-keto-4-pentenoate hydratase [Paracraurococcus lichenis]|uniref:Fumarylacetoacetate hydrolase family protein n=1 Tax=Paracraurococcus lichenis TaxID=3064888 RepID=A0ABT9DTI4_9PROT|nr:fumarylacetoacetate hydrolase family protein [Paracraurococcus sp. LOR1-02]MDO9707214.1 fumarylacetoacetate hydrolase family protein [Paracraurococcus sp. LOR1-02]